MFDFIWKMVFWYFGLGGFDSYCKFFLEEKSKVSAGCIFSLAGQC